MIETQTNHTPPPVPDGPTLFVEMNVNADVADQGVSDLFILNPDTRADLHKALDIWLDKSQHMKQFAFFMVKVPH